MALIIFQFYGELNHFLSADRRRRPFTQPVNGPQTVKHLIEALGVPHTEVEAILANDRPVAFDYLVQAGDRVQVYPVQALPRRSDLLPLRPPWPHPPRFLLDVHLGRLARYLRLLGLDALYEPALDDPELARLAHETGRILLTRDRNLLKRGLVTFGFCLHARDPRRQLLVVIRRFQLDDELRPWTRCLRCNGLLRPVAKADVLHRLEPKTKRYFDAFHQCQACDQVYWKGSHVGRLEALVNLVLAQGPDPEAVADPETVS